MASPRFYCPEIPRAAQRLALPGPVAHHALRVLRLRAGDVVVLFDGAGGEFEGRLEVDGARRASAVGLNFRDVERERGFPVTLVQALLPAERMDWVVQKAVELGAEAIQPVVSARSVSRVGPGQGARRQRHWRAVAEAACEQCGRNRVPEVAEPMPLATWFATRGDGVAGLLFLPERARSMRELPRPERGLELVVGPEGGFTQEEEAHGSAAGLVAAGLGPTVLRAETAALAGLAFVYALWD